MPRKIPGKLNPPPNQVDFDKLPVNKWCQPADGGVFYRLHTTNAATGQPWPPIHFSRKGCSRFDPKTGVGTLYLGRSLSGVLMEVFDDRWGPLGDPSRSLTRSELQRWWVTLVAIPPVLVFEADQGNLSKLGTDMQLLTGDHSTSRKWALRLMRHPMEIEGILYPSRHDSGQRNLALFKRADLLPENQDDCLVPGGTYPLVVYWGLRIAYGTPILLRDHPELQTSLKKLEVVILP